MATDTKQQVSKCRGCGADILWLDHPVTRKRAPIDAYPDITGNVIVDQEAGTWRVATNHEKLQHAGKMHNSHFATCPYSQQYRARGRK